MSRIYYDNPATEARDDDAHWQAKASGAVGDKCILTGLTIGILLTRNATDACAVCTVSEAMRQTVCNGRPPQIDNDRKKVVDAVKQGARVTSTTTVDESQLLIENIVGSLNRAFKKEG